MLFHLISQWIGDHTKHGHLFSGMYSVPNSHLRIHFLSLSSFARILISSLLRFSPFLPDGLLRHASDPGAPIF